MADAPNVNNYILGRGIVYFDRFDDDGNSTGELDLGNCEEFNLNLSTSKLDHFNYRSKFKTKDKVVVQELTTEGSLIIDEYNKENLLLMLFGTEGAFSQSSGSVVAKSHTAYSGRWIKILNASDEHVRNVSNVTVLGYVEDDDFEVDETSGRIKILSSGDIADESSITVSCTYADTSYDTLQAFAGDTVEGFLRFVGDPQAGPTYEVEIWKVSLMPNGDIPFISDDWGKLNFSFEIQKMETDHPDEPYFRIIEIDDASGTTTSTTTA